MHSLNDDYPMNEVQSLSGKLHTSKLKIPDKYLYGHTNRVHRLTWTNIIELELGHALKHIILTYLDRIQAYVDRVAYITLTIVVSQIMYKEISGSV